MSEIKNESSAPLLHEDWATVVLGLAIIVVFLLGWVLPVPSFGWSAINDVGARIFTRPNAGAIVLQFLFTYIVAAIAAVITGKNLRYTLLTFPILFLLTVVALFLAGNSGVRCRGWSP